MSLRSRLVLVLLTLSAVGLAVFGVGTYQAFADAELDRVDDDLRASVDLVAQELAALLRFGGTASGPSAADVPLVVAPGTFAELRDFDGRAIATMQVARGGARPDLSAIGRDGVDGITTVGSYSGDVTWRVVSEPTVSGGSLVVAAPMAAMQRSLDRLLAIEATAAVIVLLLLGAGAWSVLRTALRPLEQIADAAASIDSQQLGRRVPTAAGGTEVAQLARSINGMLDELEGAFAAREASEARLRRFLADASHELRTPLTSIQGFAELFRLDDGRRHVELPLVMRRIEHESHRMGALVEDLLLLARLDETRAPERVEVDLAALAADACGDAVAGVPDRPVDLDAPDALTVVGDPDHLRQALGNLLSNAVRHTPAGTPVEVLVTRQAGAPAVVVRDHGPGIDAAALGHVFDRFWQADPARVGPGAGLGLSIVQAIAAEHGGEIGVHNAEDGGAVFTLRLPTEPAGVGR